MNWYRPRRGAFPWRARPSPYRVMVSEVMLQQTQAARVAPAFERFVRRFPTVQALARAPRSEVVRAWAGLGYNRRAVALSEAARAVVRDHGGAVPTEPGELQRLPGVGPYTAAAVASLAHGQPVLAVDTNVRRVVSRALLGVDGPEAAPERIRRAGERWLDRGDPGGFNQALMDLGREVCRPRPRCESCPLAVGCRFRSARGRLVPSGRPAPPFRGSSRQLRGRIVDALRSRPSLSTAELAREVGEPVGRVTRAVGALQREGIVRAEGRVALAD